MTTEGATDAELEYVEEFALAMERMGLVRMTGRVIGWLTICDPPEQTFNQIAETLQASKGSISNALKFLTTAHWVIRTSRPGDRKDYFSVRETAITDIVRLQGKQYGPFAQLAANGLAMLDGEGAGPERKARLEEIHSFFTWLEREMPALFERWETERLAS
ncbi:GbsR/MarR family transcriptional regulator [Actinorhabdospora filicis]|nr:hypothetical protein [Actinorhabdospora filicis]